MSSKAITFKVESNEAACSRRVVPLNEPLDLTDVAGLRLEELDANGNVLDDAVPYQVTPTANNAMLHDLYLLLTDESKATTRHYRLRMDGVTDAVDLTEPLVQLTEVYHQGQAAYRITNQCGTWILHRSCGGFAALVDQDGRDWISYRPYGGSDGRYRGIPNIKHPDDYLHPGFYNATVKLRSAGPLRCQFHVKTHDGVCEAIWTIDPYFVTLKLLKVPDVYWLLYEGTPGGTLDETNDFVVWADGTRLPLGERWSTNIDAGWLYFSSAAANRSLLFLQNTPEPKLSSYFPMEGNMTVFGFGRKDLEHYLTDVPATYTFGLIEDTAYDAISTIVDGLRQDVQVTVGDTITQS